MIRILGFYFASYGTSILGNSITAIALPLVVLFTTGSPISAGVVAIAAAVPSAFAGLLMGSLIDRMNRRTAAFLSDVISAVALVLLPIIDLTVGLHLGWFIAVAVLNSFGDVPGITARETMLPAIAQSAGVSNARLIGIRESLSGIFLLLGPAMAGILIATFEPITVLWITSGLAGLAALLTLVIPRTAAVIKDDGATSEAHSQAGRSMFHGITVIFRSPVLRGLVLLGVALGVTLAATQGMVIPVHFGFQGQAQFVGFVLSALAAGLLLGGGTFAVLGQKVSHRVWFGTGLVLVSLGFIVIAVLGPVWSIFLGAALVGLGGGHLNAVIGLTFIDRVSDRERGSVLGAQNAIMTVIPALGIGAAAALIEFFSLHVATATLAAVWIACAAASLLAPALRRL